MTDNPLPPYEIVMSGIRSAALLLEAAEPTMRLLIKQVDQVESFGFITDPTQARRVMGDRNVKLQVRLARAVCVFMNEWRDIRDEAKGEP